MAKRCKDREVVWDDGMQTFLETHATDMTLQQMATALGVSLHTVWRHRNSLPDFQSYDKRRSLESDNDDEVKAPIQRPPAVYSNKSYHH
jgi:predicted ArsR family transcriptional regulator